jgi:hypothetical protein
MDKQKLPQFKKLREFSNQHREEMERRVLDSRWSLELTGKNRHLSKERSEATHREEIN